MEETKSVNRIEDNIIRVGNKPLIPYLEAILIKMDKYDEIHITAFGQKINKAIAIGEIASKKFRLDSLGITPLEESWDGRKVTGIMIRLKKC